MIATRLPYAAPATIILVAGLALASLLVGGYEMSLTSIITDPAAREMFFISRVPRTLALIFAAIAMSVSGVVMQMITQNKFVSPTTAGTASWAGLGVLAVLLIAPDAPPLLRMVFASAAAFGGTMIFMAVLRRIALTNSIVVPLVGIMLGAVVGALSTFLAGRFNLLQSMSAWRSGGFSSIVRGFYEPLWAVLAIAVAVWFAANRFTVAGLGKQVATNVGLNYDRTVLLGTVLVALATGITSVVVGFIPFLGLIVPNVVSMLRGDDLRANLPWVASLGAALLLACDLIGRVVVAPMEIPASVIMGVVGGVGFIAMIVGQRDRLSA